MNKLQLALKLKSNFINPSQTAYIRQNDVQLKPEHFQSEYFTKLICSAAHGTHILMKWKIKSYRIGLLWTHKNGDFGAISVTERSCAARTGSDSKVESHISDRCSYYTGDLFVSAQQCIWYNVKKAWTGPAIRCKLNVITPNCDSDWIPNERAE